MYSVFSIFPLQSLDVLYLEVLEILLLIEFSILGLFLIWHLKLAKINVRMIIVSCIGLKRTIQNKF